MIPLRDHNHTDQVPILTYTLIGVNVIIFAYMSSLPLYELEYFISQYALVPAAITQGSQWHTFITAMFLHGGWMHLLGNMWFLHIFGDNIEANLGKAAFLILYLLCGTLGSAAQIIIHTESVIPNLGASGAIAGVLGAYLVFFPRAQIDTLVPFGLMTRIITMPAIYMLGYWILFQVIFGLGSVPEAQANVGGVAYFAHIGGFVAGFGSAKFLQR